MNLAQKFVIMVFGLLIATSIFFAPYKVEILDSETSSKEMNFYNVKNIGFYFIINPPRELITNEIQVNKLRNVNQHIELNVNEERNNMPRQTKRYYDDEQYSRNYNTYQPTSHLGEEAYNRLNAKAERKVPARDIQISIIGAEIVLMTMFFFLFKTNKKKIE